MPTIREFEKLRVWQSARQLVNLIYELTRKPPFSNDFALRDQIRRAAISVMSNIAEGFDAEYDGEFIRFLGYSFRSTAEVQSQLYTAHDQQYVNEEDFRTGYDKAVDVRKQIRALVAYLSKSKRTGRKVKEEPVSYGKIEDNGFFLTLLDLPEELTAED